MPTTSSQCWRQTRLHVWPCRQRMYAVKVLLESLIIFFGTLLTAALVALGLH